MTENDHEVDDDEKNSIFLGGPLTSHDDQEMNWRTFLMNQIEDEFICYNPLDLLEGPVANAKFISDPSRLLEEVDEFDGWGENEVSTVIDGTEYVSELEYVREREYMIDCSDAVLIGWGSAPSMLTPMEIKYVHMKNQMEKQGLWRYDKPIVMWYEPRGSSDMPGINDLAPGLMYHADCFSSSPKACIDFIREYLRVQHNEKRINL